jgi:predicted nucleic acid-binding protein
LLATATVVVPSVDVDAVEADPDDNIVLEAALTVGADYVVSGDSHLLDLGTFQDVPILTPDDFLERIG